MSPIFSTFLCSLLVAAQLLPYRSVLAQSQYKIEGLDYSPIPAKISCAKPSTVARKSLSSAEEDAACCICNSGSNCCCGNPSEFPGTIAGSEQHAGAMNSNSKIRVSIIKGAECGPTNNLINSYGLTLSNANYHPKKGMAPNSNANLLLFLNTNGKRFKRVKPRRVPQRIISSPFYLLNSVFRC